MAGKVFAICCLNNFKQYLSEYKLDLTIAFILKRLNWKYHKLDGARTLLRIGQFATNDPTHL